MGSSWCGSVTRAGAGAVRPGRGRVSPTKYWPTPLTQRRARAMAGMVPLHTAVAHGPLARMRAGVLAAGRMGACVLLFRW
ncbi:hypothetical protein GCM10027168_09350 [Streptomyces capparidis]